jgi:phenylalanyl-tRNA synthetase beta chain
MSENKTDRTWRYKQEKVSIFDVKEILEKILTMVTSGYRLAANAPDYYHPGRSGSYIIKKDTLIAHFGEIHPSILSEMDIAGPIVCFELFLDQLPRLMTTKVKSPLILSQYQQTSRDFSFIVDKQLTVDKIINAIKNLKFDHIKKVSIFDVYEAQTIGEGKKAVALEVIMQSNQSTLTEAQINETSDAIIAIVIQECNGILRKQ